MTQESVLVLVPMPRQVSRRTGTFTCRSGGQIVLPPSGAQDLLQTAQRLRDALVEMATVSFEIVVAERGVSDAGVVTLDVDAEGVAREQGYTLDVSSGRISVVGHDVPGVFYGVCTLIQLLRQFGSALPCMSIADFPDYPARGVMLDVSRCRVPTLDTLMHLVDMLAGLKVNQLQLYTEHAFAYREHREVWADVSPLTGQDILDLDAYCRDRFVDLIPNQSSFGHLTPWLIHPRYNHLAESPDGFEWPWGGRCDTPFSLNPIDPGSLDLLGSLYDDLLPHFTSKLFNVGCDETFDLGTGRSKAVCEERGVHRVYLDFVRQIYELVKERGRTMMFWGDIILHEPDLIPELPHDAIVMEWGYEFDHPFEERCQKFADAGIPFYICPGTSSWNAVVGRTDNAIGNLCSAADVGLKHGAIGYLNTDWGDHGHWQHLPTAYLGYTYGAAVSWALDANRDLDVPGALSMHVFQDSTGTMGQLVYDMGNVYRIYERYGYERIHNANFLVRVLYAPVEEIESRGLDWGQVNPEVFGKARREIETIMAHLPLARMQVPDARLIRREYENAAHLMRHACSLGEFKVALARAETTDARAALADRANALADDMREILTEYRVLWLARNRVGGLEKGSGTHFQNMIDTYRRIAETSA